MWGIWTLLYLGDSMGGTGLWVGLMVAMWIPTTSGELTGGVGSLSIMVSLSISLPLPPLGGPTVPPRFVKKVRAVPFVEGEDVQVTCTIEGAPHPQIR